MHLGLPLTLTLIASIGNKVARVPLLHHEVLLISIGESMIIQREYYLGHFFWERLAELNKL